MPEIITYTLFVVGFVFLIKGADLLVQGASSIAKKFNISDFVIGLTIVSLGTSMPELLVNIIASVKESSDLALGNIIGSNISNIFLILGVSALIYPLNIGIFLCPTSALIVRINILMQAFINEMLD